MSEMRAEKIGIIAAMPMEIALTLEKIEQVHTAVINGVEFTMGYIGDKAVVTAYCGVGKVNAAVVTTLMITNFKVDALMMTGIAGSLNPALKIGDVLVAASTFHTEIHGTGDDNSISSPNPINHQDTPSDFRATKKLDSVSMNRVSNVPIQIGKLATSDDFPTRKEILDIAMDEHADAIDMEAAAVAQTCWLFNMPFLCIKGISNQALVNKNINDDPLASEDGLSMAAKNAQIITMTQL